MSSDDDDILYPSKRPTTGSWTRHRPTPADDDAGVCAVCRQPILTAQRRANGVVAVHAPRDDACKGGEEAHVAHLNINGECPWCGAYTNAKLPIRFDAERQKVLYELLDAALLDVTYGPQHMARALSTIHRWSTDEYLWKTVRRWCRDHGEDLS